VRPSGGAWFRMPGSVFESRFQSKLASLSPWNLRIPGASRVRIYSAFHRARFCPLRILEIDKYRADALES
jgi:hypothetical protein